MSSICSETLASSPLTPTIWNPSWPQTSRVRSANAGRAPALDYVLGSRSDALRAFLGEGIFTQDGPKWKHSREMLRRPFVKMHYQNLTGFGEHVEDLIVNLKRCTGVVDLQPYCFRFTLATTTALIFGQPIKDYETQTQHRFASSFDYASLISPPYGSDSPISTGPTHPPGSTSLARLSRNMLPFSLNKP